MLLPSADGAGAAPTCGASRSWTASAAVINQVIRYVEDLHVRLQMEVHMKQWTKRWNCWIAPKPTRPGVWRRKEGGYLARGRAKCPRTGKLREIKITMPTADAVTAYHRLQQELQKVRQGRELELLTQVSFGEYAVSLLERKVRSGEIRSAKSKEKWGYILRLHLLPFFGALLMEQIRRADVEQWKDEQARLIRAGAVMPGTVNDRLGVLKVIINTAVGELELDRNPVLSVKDFDVRLHPTYSEEQPNSLTLDEVPEFLVALRGGYPQHFAFTALGFGTGLRPSSLRPLRRSGPTPDVLWDEGAILVRRSHTRKQEVMETTKTGKRQRLSLPVELMEILRWHVDRLPEGPMQESDLLFPSRTGGLMSASALDKPFRAVTEAMGLSKRITPRAMRRTFQDLARAAEVKDIVTRAISGHATETMQRHYSTVHAEEIQAGIAKVVSLAKVREAMAGSAAESDSGGVHGGVHGAEKAKTASRG